MSLSVGIVGLPNTGKSTLFNALLKKQAALAASYPFATIEPNIGVVPVPDKNLEQLMQVAQREYLSQKETEKKLTGQEKKEIAVVPATIKFLDIAGLVEGAHAGEGLGNQFLSHIREVDAILHLVRGFEDENVPRAGSVSPQKDIELINAELLLADLQTVEKRLNSKKYREDKAVLEKIKGNLEKGILANEMELESKEKEYLQEMHLLTAKPMLYVLNVSEVGLQEEGADAIGAFDFIKISAQVEADLSAFSDNERREYLRELGIKESGLNQVIKACYKLLRLQKFYTYGPKEVHAWTVEEGSTAVEAAGEIHTDFAKGFIKAEVINCHELFKVGSWKAAKEKGAIRLEGKEYIMQEGDVVIFRFNL
jgi:hypothetical protein